MLKTINPDKILSVTAIARDIADGRLAPQDALLLGMENIKNRESEIKAFAHFDPSDLRTGNSGPLSGIAIGIKDIFDTYDMPTEYGSAIYSGFRPKTDSALVALLRRAGATIAAKTVTTEFAYFSPGPTRNPHNLTHTPGGSSSGSAASVAAGYFPAAIGTQTGGSIIRPASYCGVAGYKPSFKLFPTQGAKCFSWSLDTIGFFAKSIDDVAFVAAKCSGRDLHVDGTELSPPRIGVYRSHLFDRAGDDMKLAFDHTIKLAADAGAPITEIPPVEELNQAYDAHSVIQGFEAGLACADALLRFGDQMSNTLRNTLEDGQRILPRDYDLARRTANNARKSLHPLFRQLDVLITPSAPGIAPKGLESTGEPVFNKIWTLVGTPCVNVPGIFNPQGMPLGIQIVAGFGRDKLALMAAHWLEKLIFNAAL